jgi:hypothetical protein
MQSQREVEQEKGALFGESQTKMVTTTVKEITPHGVKLELNQEGQFAGSAYNAREIGTTSVFWKMDGTFDWETRVIHMTQEGDVIVGSARGTGRSTPSGNVIEGESLLMTGSQRLSSVNNRRVRIEGTSNMATGETRSKAYLKQ